jgi:GMP synthase-like glutamine amidotransferase
MKYHVLQHVSFETPGLLGDEIRARGHLLFPTALYDQEPLPSLADFDVLIVMGGPMSVHNEADYPWLVAEKELIAAACGARVYPNPVKEIGFWPVRWVSGKEEIVFHWHGETFDLPDGAVLLASTEACVNQAFSLGDRVLGVQFHPEVTAEIIRGVVDQEGWELVVAGKTPYVDWPERILGGAREMERRGERDGRIGWLLNWLWPIRV